MRTDTRPVLRFWECLLKGAKGVAGLQERPKPFLDITANRPRIAARRLPGPKPRLHRHHLALHAQLRGVGGRLFSQGISRQKLARKGSNRRLESGLYVPNKRRRDVLPLRIYGLTPLGLFDSVFHPQPVEQRALGLLLADGEFD